MVLLIGLIGMPVLIVLYLASRQGQEGPLLRQRHHRQTHNQVQWNGRLWWWQDQDLF